MPAPKHATRRNGIWYFKAEIGGRRFRQSLETRDAREAGQLAREAYRAALKESRDARSSNPTVGRFADVWLREYIAQERGAKGAANATQRLRDFILPELASHRLSQVTLAHARKVRARTEAAGAAPRTVRHVLSDLRCLLRYGQESGLLAQVPRISRVFPDVPPALPAWLTNEDLEKILAAANVEHRAMIQLAVWTCLRWSEQRALRRDWISWSPYPKLSLPSSKKKNGIGAVEEIPLFPEATAAIHQLIGMHSSVLVQRVQGKNPCNISTRIGNRAGVVWHWHQLRHTGGRLLREMGLDLQERQKLMRHSTPLLTARYSEVTGDGLYRRMMEVSGQGPQPTPGPATVLKAV